MQDIEGHERMSHRRDDSPLFCIALNPTVTLYIVEILVANCTFHRCKQIAISMRLACNACNLQFHFYIYMLRRIHLLSHLNRAETSQYVSANTLFSGVV